MKQKKKNKNDALSPCKLNATVCCNQMGRGFAEMSSWTATSWYTVMKTALITKNMKSKSFVICIKKFLNFKSD